MAKTRAKKEQRLAVTVAASPTDMIEMSQSRPEEPMRIRKAKACGYHADLVFCQ